MNSPSPWKPIRRQTHRHSPHLDIEDVDFELPSGEQKRYSLTHPELRVASVLALTSDHSVVLARQFRPGPDRILDELPGGHVEAGESFERAVARELLEETGFVPARIIPLGRFFEGAYSRIEKRGFLALGCEKKGDQCLDPTEFIEVIRKPLPEFLSQLRRGECTDSEVAWCALWEAGFVRDRV